MNNLGFNNDDESNYRQITHTKLGVCHLADVNVVMSEMIASRNSNRFIYHHTHALHVVNLWFVVLPLNQAVYRTFIKDKLGVLYIFL